MVLAGGCSPEPETVYSGYGEAEFVYVAPTLGGALEVLSVRRGVTVDRESPLFALDRAEELARVREAAARLDQAESNVSDLLKGNRPSELAQIEAQLAQAKARLSLATTTLARRKKLLAGKAASQEALDQAQEDWASSADRVRELQAALRTAKLGGREDAIEAARAEVRVRQAALAQAQWSLQQKTVAAPVSGFVYDTYYDPGEVAAAGSPVVSILPPENLKVRFFVPEAALGRLAVGQEVELSCDGCPGTILGRVSYISPKAEYTPPVIYSSSVRAKLVFMVEALPDPAGSWAPHPGQPVDVRPRR